MADNYNDEITTALGDLDLRLYYNGVRDGQRRALEVVEHHVRAALMQSDTAEDLHAGLQEALCLLDKIRNDRGARFLERL